MNSLVPWAKIARARTGMRKGMEHPDTGPRAEAQRAAGRRVDEDAGSARKALSPAIYGLSDSGLTPPP